MSRYDALAKYYETLIQEEEAVLRWFDFTMEHCRGNEFLELACGCGDLAYKLAENGKNVMATDLSEKMIEEANKRPVLPNLSFEVMNMLNFTTDKKFDTICCYCDSFNYLESYEEVALLFENVYSHLHEKGVFLFDMHSLDRLKEFEDEYIEEGMLDDEVGYQWTINSEDNKIYQHLAFYTPNGLEEEEHLQMVFDPLEIIKMMEKIGFAVECKTDFDKEGITSGEKIFIVGRKK